MALNYVGMDVRATFGESGSNNGRIILLFFTGQTRFTHHFVQYLIAFCSRPEATSNAISDIFAVSVIPDNHEKFGDHRINLS